MSGPLFLTPLRVEAASLAVIRPRPEVRRIGMGPVAATSARARLGRELRETRPLVLFGFAGALDPELRAGELVVSRSVSSLRGEEEFLLPEAAGVAALLESAGVTARLGGLVSVPHVLHGAAAREKAAASGALICDMEALWMMPLARQHPFVVVRAVVDTVAHPVASLATPRAALVAFRALVRSARALARWAPTTVDNYPLLEVGES